MVNAVENWLFVIWRFFVSPATRALPMFLLVCQIYEYCKLTQRRTTYPETVAVVDTSNGAIDQTLTKNDKRSEGEMSIEK